jgi:shikimate dehydrogenase
MHNAAFRAMGLNAVYLTFDTEEPADCLSGVRGLGIRGLSVTIPHKISVLPLLDRIDDVAKRIGAVNTIVNKGGVLSGYNTDASGALKALLESVNPRGKKSLVLGAGGVARAVAFALKNEGSHVTISNRTPHKGQALARAVNGSFLPLQSIAEINPHILIQATSVGMKGGPKGLPMPREFLREGTTVLETIYNPQKTEFLACAEESGCRVIGGLEMFLWQGAEQIRLWTGLEPPLDVMRRAIDEELGKRK